MYFFLFENNLIQKYFSVRNLKISRNEFVWCLNPPLCARPHRLATSTGALTASYKWIVTGSISCQIACPENGVGQGL